MYRLCYNAHMALDTSNQKNLYNELRGHIGHQVFVMRYGGFDGFDDDFEPAEFPHNVAIECHTCNEILLDADHPDINLPPAPK